eukprot:94541_1
MSKRRRKGKDDFMCRKKPKLDGQTLQCDWKALVLNDQLTLLTKSELHIYFKENNLRISGKKLTGNKQELIDRIKVHKQNAIQQEAENNIKSIFSHPQDHKQFITIFLSIEQSKLLKALGVTTVISHNIAEYSTGEIHNCSNPKCKNEIAFVQQNYTDLLHQEAFEYFEDREEYFCSHCQNTDEIINCQECNVTRLKTTSEICEKCNTLICCNEDCAVMQTREYAGMIDWYTTIDEGSNLVCCEQCEKRICATCSEWCTCFCGINETNICADHMKSGNCSSCGRYDGMMHKCKQSKCYDCTHRIQKNLGWVMY